MSMDIQLEHEPDHENELYPVSHSGSDLVIVSSSQPAGRPAGSDLVLVLSSRDAVLVPFSVTLVPF